MFLLEIRGMLTRRKCMQVLLNSMTLCKIIYHETKLLARHLKPTGYRLQV